MAMLHEMTSLIRSKNAGPFLLTLDVVFRDRQSYDAVVKSGVVTGASIAEMYGVAADQVKFFLCPEIMAIKATFPRSVGSGDPLDSDIYGAQQIGPLLNVKIPER